MARRKKAKTRKVYVKAKRRAKKSGASAGIKPEYIALGGLAYGALREKASQWLQPLTSKIPVLGDYTDEALLATAGYAMAKGKMPLVPKGKISKTVGLVILAGESMRVGSTAGGLLNAEAPQQQSTATLFG